MTAALAQLHQQPGKLDCRLVADFFALGFCHLQVELLTRQLRYMSNLDDVQFQKEVTAAAEDALADKGDSAREHLRAAFDLLTEAREYFYPVEAHLLDLTLVAPTTIGASLRAELASEGPTNLLVSGQTIQQMALREPATLAALKEAIQQGKAAIVGGEFDEHELPLLGPEAILAQFERGSNSYERYLDRRPEVFGRRRFGLSPVLPQIVRRLGFSGVLHFTLDDGRFPTGNQSKIRWQGLDATSVGALGRLPVDASRHECFLRLPERLGDAMDLDHTATAVFAHWPGQASPWYRDLRRMADYSPALGRFLLVTDYFQTTEHSGQTVRYKADQYRSPYLSQAVAAKRPDPISSWVRYYRRRAAAETEAALCTLAELVDGGRPHSPPDENLLLAVEDSRTGERDSHAGLDDRLAGRLEVALGRLAAALPRQDRPPKTGYLLANPSSFARRVCLDVSNLDSPPDASAPVERVGDWGGRNHAVVEVPPMGFAWIGAGTQAPPQAEKLPEPKRRKKKKGQTPPPMAEENRLRNEFFEVLFDPTTGAIRAVHDYSRRGNRLAQQIAFRFPRGTHTSRGGFGGGDSEMAYSVMAADELSIISDGPLVGQMRSRGRLLDREGRRLARFVQTTRVERGSRVLEMDIELDIEREPGDRPWDSYYAARFAWGDATADFLRGVGLTSQPSDAAQIEAPYFAEVRAEKGQTTILTGGLPYHRRLGLRKLDTLLVVRGETARRFRLGIGVNLRHPAPAAIDFLSPRPVLAEKSPPPEPRFGWLFHVDSKSVVATHWAPLFSGGRVSGFRARLLETEGRRCQVRLRAFRSLESAARTDFTGDHPEPLSVDGDRITIDVDPNGWVQLEGKFVEGSPVANSQ